MVGAWSRDLFAGGGLETTSKDETCANLITPGLFIDIRIPTTRDKALRKAGRTSWDDVSGLLDGKEARPLAALSNLEVRLLARQHAFGGYARFEPPSASSSSSSSAIVGACARHHAIDWNFMGEPRPRPNKWHVEPLPPKGGQADLMIAAAMRQGGYSEPLVDEWLELSYANDESGKPYYHEKWSRLGSGSGEMSYTALRAQQSSERDAFVIIVNDHFAYVRGRPIDTAELSSFIEKSKCGRRLFDVVDEALARGDRDLAERCVLLEAGYGRVSNGWLVDASLQPWRIGKNMSNVFDGEIVGPVEGLERTWRVGGVLFDVLASSSA